MTGFWPMFTTTLGSAAVIAAISMLFFSSKRRSELHKNNKALHRLIVAILFGLLSIYASVSAVEIDGALCNCRNLAPLYAGLVAGPWAGIGAALIGGLFRFFVYGGVSAWPCMIACILAGVIGSLAHVIFKKKIKYNVFFGMALSVITEGCHMLLLCIFDLSSIAAQIALPIVLSNILGMAFCLFIYKRFAHTNNAEEVSKE